MSDNISSKKITTVEELNALEGTENIFVNSNGTIKQINPANANFGGGGVEMVMLAFTYLTESGSYSLFKVESGVPGSAPTPQEIYDWFYNGSIIVLVSRDIQIRHYVTGIMDCKYGPSDMSAPSTNITKIKIYSSLSSDGFEYGS